MFLVSFFFFSSRRRHTRSLRDWSSDVCSSDLKSTAHHSFRHVVATAHDPGFHSGQREFNGWNPQEEKVDFISQLLEAANHAQVAPARKSRLKEIGRAHV